MRRTWSTWNPFKPFGREKADVVWFLEGALDGTLDCRAWDGFLRTQMKGAPDLEAIRVACAALESEESISDKGTITHSEPARKKIRSLLADLRENA